MNEGACASTSEPPATHQWLRVHSVDYAINEQWIGKYAEGCDRGWPHLKHHPNIYLDKPRKKHKSLSQDSRSPTSKFEPQTCLMTYEFYPLGHDVLSCHYLDLFLEKKCHCILSRLRITYKPTVHTHIQFYLALGQKCIEPGLSNYSQHGLRCKSCQSLIHRAKLLVCKQVEGAPNSQIANHNSVPNMELPGLLTGKFQ